MRSLALGLSVFLVACGGTNKIKVSGGAETRNSVEAKIVMEYPQAERCFTSPLVDTYEKLKECLELTTDQSFSVGVEGELIDLMGELEGLKGAEK